MIDRGLSDLETTIATIKPLDHEKVEWQRVSRTRFLVHQCLRYEYPAPIYELDQRLMILPLQRHWDQHLIGLPPGSSCAEFRDVLQGQRIARIGYVRATG